jgi:hypothetical protein
MLHSHHREHASRSPHGRTQLMPCVDSGPSECSRTAARVGLSRAAQLRTEKDRTSDLRLGQLRADMLLLRLRGRRTAACTLGRSSRVFLTGTGQEQRLSAARRDVDYSVDGRRQDCSAGVPVTTTTLRRRNMRGPCTVLHLAALARVRCISIRTDDRLAILTADLREASAARGLSRI